MKSAARGVSALLGLMLAWGPASAIAATTIVNPGQSIQDAIDAAAPGDVVRVMPGDYTETHGNSAALRITKSLKLIANSKLPDVKVRLLPGPGNNHGILVEPENPGDPDVERVQIRGFTIEGFPKNGIWTRHVQRFKILGNESINNLENGIFPTLSAKGLVRKNVSYGSLDSALWVEGSENVRVINNELHDSPTGLEITVSKKILAKKNHVHHNTIGIGLYHPNGAALPPLGDDGDWDIVGNYVHDNNLPNPVSGGLVGELPPGGGILLLGVDRVNLRKNKIVNNDFFGVALIDYCIAVGGSSFDCSVNPPIVDPAPNDNDVSRNQVTSNGVSPPPGPFAPLASDILLLGGSGNCFDRNTTDLTIPASLPACS